MPFWITILLENIQFTDKKPSGKTESLFTRSVNMNNRNRQIGKNVAESINYKPCSGNFVLRLNTDDIKSFAEFADRHRIV